jgi:hypothetical protein
MLTHCSCGQSSAHLHGVRPIMPQYGQRGDGSNQAYNAEDSILHNSQGFGDLGLHADRPQMSSEVWAFAPSMVQCGPADDHTLLNTASICTTVPTTIHLQRPAGSIGILYDPQPTPVPHVQLNNPFPTHPHPPPSPRSARRLHQDCVRPSAHPQGSV